MSTIAILEGNVSYNYGEDAFLGWNPFKKVGKIVNKVTRPIRKVVRPIYKPLDRTLKKIPIVRTAYRGAIASTYASTGQLHKVWGATKRTGASAIKDVKGLKNTLIKIAIAIVKPMARAGMAKGVAKLTAIPIVTAKANALSPMAMPFAGIATNTAIDIVWKNIKKSAGKIIPGASKMASIARNIAGGGYNAQKMSDVPSPSGGMGFDFPQYGQPPAQYAEEAPKSKAPLALLALIPLAFMMG